jgi:hypothetical protein
MRRTTSIWHRGGSDPIMGKPRRSAAVKPKILD